MKKEFIGYYDPTKDEIENTWKNGIFAFDANTLLNLYRYTDHTRKDFIESLKSIEEKLFLPYQAAFEYHSNRLNVIEGIGNSYSTLENILKDNFDKYLFPQINQFKKHPSIVIDSIIKLHNDFLKKVAIQLENQKKKHPDFLSEDNVLAELTNLFDSRIGKSFSREELKKIYLEGKERYDNQIPPGYKDLENKKKRGDQHIYGDLIIWKELMNLAKKEKKPLIFVTDDRKEDWWRVENGKTIRAREELIKEFYDATNIRILIYNADNFLKYAKEHQTIPHSIKDKTINEIKETRIADENIVNSLFDLSNYFIHSREKDNIYNSYFLKPNDVTRAMIAMDKQHQSWKDLYENANHYANLQKTYFDHFISRNRRNDDINNNQKNEEDDNSLVIE